MKNHWLFLSAALLCFGITAGLAQERDTLHGQDQRSETRTSEQNTDRDELRDAAGSPMPTQQRDLRRAPGGVNDATTPGMQRGAAAGAEEQGVTRVNAGAGNTGLMIGGLFLALIVFILYRRSRRVETPYNRP